VVGIKHNNRKENCAGSEDVTRDHRCAHLAQTSRLMRRSLKHRASCVAVATRTSTGVACSLALEVPPPRGFGDAAACPPRAPLSLALWIGKPPPLLWIEKPRPPRVEVMELRPPAGNRCHRTRALPSLALWIRSRRRWPRNRCRRPGNHCHRMSRSGSRDHRSRSTAARAIGQPPSLMNRDGACKTDP
jgi:hypothetical protein